MRGRGKAGNVGSWSAELRVSLVHEGRFWFDELDRANGVRQMVVVSDPLRPRRSLGARTGP